MLLRYALAGNGWGHGGEIVYSHRPLAHLQLRIICPRLAINYVSLERGALACG